AESAPIPRGKQMSAVDTAVSPPALRPVREQGRLGALASNLGRSRAGIVGVALLLTFTCCALFAPAIAPQDPQRQRLNLAMRPPSWLPRGAPGYLLGSDQLGRDILSRIIYGARVSLVVGFASVALSLTIGVTIGLIAGFFGGWLDDVLMRIVDIQ